MASWKKLKSFANLDFASLVQQHLWIVSLAIAILSCQECAQALPSHSHALFGPTLALTVSPGAAFSAGPAGEVASLVYIGGSGSEDLCGITEESEDEVWVVGSTTSHDLPVHVNGRSEQPVQAAYSGGGDVFVANLKSTGEIR
eukprot:scaffold47184_cov38-Prasinocladus_malaysianus.AAC.1